MKILVVTEMRQGKWNPISFETLVAAQKIAAATSAEVSALAIASGADVGVRELSELTIHEALNVEHPLLNPGLVLFPPTYQVRDFAPKLAASLGKGMIGDCIDFRSDSGKLVFIRQ